MTDQQFVLIVIGLLIPVIVALAILVAVIIYFRRNEQREPVAEKGQQGRLQKPRRSRVAVRRRVSHNNGGQELNLSTSPSKGLTEKDKQQIFLTIFILIVTVGGFFALKEVMETIKQIVEGFLACSLIAILILALAIGGSRKN